MGVIFAAQLIAFDLPSIFGGTSTFTRNGDGAWNYATRGTPHGRNKQGPVTDEGKNLTQAEAEAFYLYVTGKQKPLRDYYNIEEA